MTKEYLRSIITECESAAYYLPSIETQVSPEVAREIRKHLSNIELYALLLNDSESQALQYMRAHCSSLESVVYDEPKEEG